MLRSCQEIGAVLIDSPDQYDGEGDGFVRPWDFLVKDSTWKKPWVLTIVEVSVFIPPDRRCQTYPYPIIQRKTFQPCSKIICIDL